MMMANEHFLPLSISHFFYVAIFLCHSLSVFLIFVSTWHTHTQKTLCPTKKRAHFIESEKEDTIISVLKNFSKYSLEPSCSFLILLSIAATVVVVAALCHCFKTLWKCHFMNSQHINGASHSSVEAAFCMLGIFVWLFTLQLNAIDFIFI